MTAMTARIEAAGMMASVMSAGLKLTATIRVMVMTMVMVGVLMMNALVARRINIAGSGRPPRSRSILPAISSSGCDHPEENHQRSRAENKRDDDGTHDQA